MPNGEPEVHFGDVSFAFVAGPRKRIVEIDLLGEKPPAGEVHGLRYRAAT